MGALLPPVMGSVVEHRVGGVVRRRVYMSGDTLTGPHLDQIRIRHPDIDVVVMHLGGTRVLFHTVTMDGVQGVDFLRRVRPASAIPVHYDDYRVFRSPLQDFLSEMGRSGLTVPLRMPGRGETVALDGLIP
jgi:L-ascorbate metabolism protein UlaG (beta-lactamase superfamily)